MKKETKYIEELEEFKALLHQWEDNEPTEETRTLINKRLNNIRNLVLRADCLGIYDILPPPAVGGKIMTNVDPFTIIFDPPYRHSIIPNLIDMIDNTIGVIETSKNFSPNTKIKEQSNMPNKVFLVHGHDNELKETTARFLEKLGLTPIILHEQPSKGLTIIEKIEEFSDVNFAIVLLTPDDMGSSKGKEDSPLKRARQNVIFELGYFIGKLGRKNIAGLVKGKIEIPSDYTGVIYIDVDRNDAWKTMLAKEIKTAGLNIDLNRII